MATQKVNIPSPAIFQTDPEEQIYARGTLDPDVGGFAYAFKNAAQLRRTRDEGTYLQGVSEANKLAAALAQQEDRQKMLMEVLKAAPDLVKAGLPIAQIPLAASIFTGGGTDAQTASASSLPLDAIRATIAEKGAAAAAHAAAGANAGTDKWTVDADSTAGDTGLVTVKGVGRDPVKLREEAIRQMQALAKARAAGGSLAPAPITKWGAGTTSPKSEEYDPNRRRDNQRR